MSNMTPAQALAEYRTGCIANTSTEALEILERGMHYPVRFIYTGWMNFFFSPEFQEAADIGHELQRRKFEKVKRIRESKVKKLKNFY